MTDACRRFDPLIARAQLSTQEAAELEAHLADCSSCRELAREVKPASNDMVFAATGVTATLPDDSHASPRDDRDAPAVTTDRYRVTGGVGRVLRALDQVLDPPVALEELASTNDGTRRRFIREALITARLQHPSIVPIYDAGDRSPFYAMKLVAGRPLDTTIAEAKTLAERLALLSSMLAVADAMAHAHSERIIHRDLKPTNVLVGKYGETLVIDWGLAMDLAVDDRDALDAGPYRAAGLDQTVAGGPLGTPAYMAPEQAAGEAVDERADVYALGAILYHVVSGAIPHEGTTLDEMVRRVVRGDVLPLTERVPDVPRDFAAIVNRAMALAPSERYPSAQGLAEDLRRFLNGQLVASRTYGTRELVWRWIKRHRSAVTVALAALVVVGVGGIASVTRIVRAKHQASEAAAVAVAEKNSATEVLADMLTEQGRQELLAGHPARAAVYLVRALAQSRAPSVALRSLLADAMRPLDAQRMSLDGHAGKLKVAAFSHDGTRILTAGDDKVARVWDSASGTVVLTLDGHVLDDIGIRSASFSPDDSRIVTASDVEVRVWDARTGSALAAFARISNEILSAKFSPDGTRILTVVDRGTPALWDATTGKLLASFAGHRDLGDTPEHTEAHAAAFSADGSLVVTGGADHTAKVWDANTGKLLRTLEGHRGAVTSVAFSPDDLQIVGASDGQTARLWDARTGELQAVLEGHTNAIMSVAYSPDSTRVVTASWDDTAKLWDAQTGKFLATLVGHNAPVDSAAFSPDGARVVTVSRDHTAKLWEVSTGRLLASFDGHRDDVKSASFSRDGTQIVTASADGTAKIWDARPSKLRMSLEGGLPDESSSVLSPDGTRTVTVVGAHEVEVDVTAKLWDAQSGKLVASLAGDGCNLVSAGFDAAGTRVLTATYRGTVKVWDAKTGKLLASLETGDLLHAAALSPDGTRVTTATFGHGARLWNANTGASIASLEGHGDDAECRGIETRAVAFSMDGSRVVTADGDGGCRIRTTDNGKPVVELHDCDMADSIAFSRDGERVLASLHRIAKLWDARTGKLLVSFDGHTLPVQHSAFSPDGARVVTASLDRTAKLWDARTGKLLASLDGHTAAVNHAAFDKDGTRVVTASADHTAKVWDARTGKLLASLDGHTEEVVDAVFSPDGASVVTTSRDGSTKIWDVRLEARSYDEIQRVISARDPWTMSNGGLVPVPVESAAH